MKQSLVKWMLLLVSVAAAPSLSYAAPAGAPKTLSGHHPHRARHHSPPRPVKHEKKVDPPKQK